MCDWEMVDACRVWVSQDVIPDGGRLLGLMVIIVGSCAVGSRFCFFYNCTVNVVRVSKNTAHNISIQL